ncbi:TetR/AcrR family transcriptional regulator [Mesorhizobium sp. SARCC-RB16n]|uniref:TetR/AcrR family transcriptional regulator n=1 Tax=Mesorhizobium sp. SARCC-RB16n TaxID=2116687 RepID=UPI00122EB05B|nr:TetR/AcrR family transcriptional regulator [Mesorhizobium sp. SARCC-RB16n]KAA3450312.1 TetR/AcrR family transcriptional regulator [Mesorhizobium sp. SARCC-RB16n]
MEKIGTKLSRAEQKARRPQEILEAAFEEFTANGYAATRVEDVAARLGVTKGTIYLYFPTKDELFEAMHRQMSAPFSDLRASVAVLEGSCSERLRALVRLAYEKVANDRRIRELLRLVLAEGARFPHMVDRHYEEFIAPVEDAIGALVREGVSSGEFRRTAVAVAPAVLVSPVLHATFLRLMFADRRPFDETTFMEAHIDLVLNGLLMRNG